MKTVGFGQATLEACVEDAQQDRVVVLRGGRPVALIVGVEGMDEEQLAMASSQRFWELIQERRGQDTVSRSQLEQILEGDS